jgi:WD40 repeat protein
MNSTPPSNSLIKSLSVACALFLGIHGASAQSTTIFTEGFENTFPGTWTIGDPIPMPSEPRGIALHPDGSTLGVICAGVDGLEISIADQSVKTLFNEDAITRPGATLNNGRCSYSPDGSTFASWGTFQYCHLWNRKQQRLLLPPYLYLQDSNAFDLSFHQNTITRAMVASQMRVEFIDLTTGKPSAPDIPYTNWSFLTRFHPDGKHLLTAGGAETAQVWK